MNDLEQLKLIRSIRKLRNISAKERLLIYDLASRMDEQGGSFPSYETIAEGTSLSRATVGRIIAALKGRPELAEVIRKPYHSNRYALKLKQSHGETVRTTRDVELLASRCVDPATWPKSYSLEGERRLADFTGSMQCIDCGTITPTLYEGSWCWQCWQTQRLPKGYFKKFPFTPSQAPIPF